MNPKYFVGEVVVRDVGVGAGRFQCCVPDGPHGAIIEEVRAMAVDDYRYCIGFDLVSRDSIRLACKFLGRDGFYSRWDEDGMATFEGEESALRKLREIRWGFLRELAPPCRASERLPEI